MGYNKTRKPERDPWIYSPMFSDKDVNPMKGGKTSTNSNGVPE